DEGAAGWDAAVLGGAAGLAAGDEVPADRPRREPDRLPRHRLRRGTVPAVPGGDVHDLPVAVRGLRAAGAGLAVARLPGAVELPQLADRIRDAGGVLLRPV